MKNKFFVVLALLGTSITSAADLEGFGIIREFGGTDNAALFGVLPNSGTFQISSVNGPSFLGGFHAGELTAAALDHLFVHSTLPMSTDEKQDLIGKYNGAQVIYFEGYTGSLCGTHETEYQIEIGGALDGSPMTAVLDFIALPNSSGDCTYHMFTTSTQGSGSGLR